MSTRYSARFSGRNPLGPSLEWQRLPLVRAKQPRRRIGLDHAVCVALGALLALAIAAL